MERGQNNKAKNREERTLELQGRHNLEMGIHLAWEDMMAEAEAIGEDESLSDMPPENVAALFAAVNAERAKIKTEKKHAAFRKNIIRWGMVTAAILVLIPAAAMNVSASRTAIANYVIQNFEQYSKIKYDQEYNACAPFGWRSEYYPRWLPEHYQFDSVSFTENGDGIWYKSSNKEELSFSIITAYKQPEVNSENFEEKSILINEMRATLYLSEDRRYAILYLPLQDCAIQIEGIISEEDAIQIMKSVKIS